MVDCPSGVFRIYQAIGFVCRSGSADTRVPCHCDVDWTTIRRGAELCDQARSQAGQTHG
jgi:hypothetical protein